jgi:hypothetical protein
MHCSSVLRNDAFCVLMQVDEEDGGDGGSEDYFELGGMAGAAAA